MTRVPNRGEPPAMLDVLRNVEMSPRSQEGILRYLSEHPRHLEALEWILDNIDPRICPDGVSLVWVGYDPVEDTEETTRIHVTNAHSSTRAVAGTPEHRAAFRETFYRLRDAFPDVHQRFAVL